MLAGISDRALHASLSELGVCPLYLTGMDTDLLSPRGPGPRGLSDQDPGGPSAMTTVPLQTLPMRPAETNTRPSFVVPPGSCDAHFHVFEPGFAHVPEPLYTFPDATVDAYLALLQVLGIERMVLVQPTFYGTDNALVLDVLRRVGPRCRAVVRIEEDVSDAELDRYHDMGVRAVRLDLFARASQSRPEIIDYIGRMGAAGSEAADGICSSIRPAPWCGTCCRSWRRTRSRSSSTTWVI